MKKYIVFFLLGCMLFATACQSWLDEERFDKVDSEMLYKSEESINGALNGLYSLTRKFFRFRNSDTQGIYWFYCADDLGILRTYNDNLVYRNGMRPDAMPAEMWSRPYQLIDRASGIITNASSITMKEESRDKIISEARVLRAWSYLRLLNTYDNILLDTIPTTPDNFDDPIDYKPAKKEDVLKQINADLDYAITRLEYKVKPGVVGQALARQLRAESAMLFGDYATAAKHTDDIIAKSHHKLVDINNVFGNNVNHEETLFAWQFDLLTGGTDNPEKAGGDGHEFGACFQARFYEIKLTGESVAPIIEGAEYGGNVFGWTYPNQYLRSLYDEAKDKRMGAYFYPDILYGNNPASKYFEKQLPGTPPYSTQFRQYAWSVMKYRDLEKYPKTAISYKPLIAYRLAETYLLAAEAHWRNGNSAKGLEYLNKVRNRAGLDDATTINLQAIMDEDARELCFEGKRWFFLKRIGKLVEQVNKYHKFGGTPTTIVAMPMKDHMVRWPIPQTQIDAMGTFPQNEIY